MAISSNQISFVLQGSVTVGWDIRYTARQLRSLFPGCAVLLSTQQSAARGFEGAGDFDKVILGSDPGALPPIKWDGAPHNINRQIASSRAGMEAVRTPYAVKMRTDSYLTSDSLLRYWDEWSVQGDRSNAVGAARILSVSVYSVDPHYDERLSYHISDWFQLGTTADLLRFWSGPEYDMDMATWYERHPYAEGSLKRERETRSRYSTEQWLTLNYLFDRDSFPIKFHNDTSADIIAAFEDRLVDNFFIVHPIDIGLKMPKHQQAYRNRYFRALCYGFEDWKRVAKQRRGLDGQLSGTTLWPITPEQKRFYIGMRNRFSWMRHFPLQRISRWFS